MAIGENEVNEGRRSEEKARSVKHVGFFVGQEEAEALRRIRNTYHVSTTNLFRLYLIWLMETKHVPIGLPNSIYEITRDPGQG